VHLFTFVAPFSEFDVISLRQCFRKWKCETFCRWSWV